MRFKGAILQIDAFLSMHTSILYPWSNEQKEIILANIFEWKILKL